MLMILKIYLFKHDFSTSERGKIKFLTGSSILK